MNITAILNSLSITPVWLLDIDGVVNSWDPPKPHMIHAYGEYKRYNLKSGDNIYPVWWSPAVVNFINEVNRSRLAEVVWLTTWGETAVTEFAPLVGLDAFPTITDMSGGERAWELDWWKWRRVRDFLGDNEPRRAVVWTDDDLSRQVKDAFRYRYDPEKDSSVLLTVQRTPGLRPKDMKLIREFLEAQRG